MRICVMADPRALPPELDMEKPPAPGPGGFSISCLPLRPGESPRELPATDLLVLPASFYLDLPPLSRPHPSIVYGPPALMAEAFRAGCADYLREPWSREELEARAGRLACLGLRIGDRVVVVRARGLDCGGARVELGEAEHRAFRILALSLNSVVPRAALTPLAGEASRAADVLISSLRRKLETLGPGLSSSLKAVRGQGYLLVGEACG